MSKGPAPKSIWFMAVMALLVVVWQLIQGVWLGRMHDMVDEGSDYLFFFESPFWFIVQFVLLAGGGVWLVLWIVRQLSSRDRSGRDQ